MEIPRTYHPCTYQKGNSISKNGNAPDIKSNSIKSITDPWVIKLVVMSSIKIKVQLIGNVGETPKVTELENGKKVCRFSLATNEVYMNNGEKKEDTQWHNLVAWNKKADIVERFVEKGKGLIVSGKLTYSNYEDKNGIKVNYTEILVDEILFSSTKTSNN